jgi:hypothetical protein
MWLLLLACREAPDDSDPIDVPDDVCDGGNELPVAPLPSSPTWESGEREYGTGLGWGDFDGDGWRDLVVASGNDKRPGPLSVHRGGEQGLPADPEVVGAEAYRAHVAVGDVDGDGYDDVVSTRFLGSAGFDEAGGVDLHLGGPDGLSATPAWSADGFYTFSAALGDADGDGDLDLAVAVGEAYEHDPWPQRLYTNDGGTFGAEPSWTSADSAHAFDVGFVDWGGDGDLDLVYARTGAPHAVYENDGGFGAEPAWLAPGEGFEGNSLDVGDVDGDGADDLVVTETMQSTGPGLVRLYCGAAWELCWQNDREEHWSAVSLVDLDGDDDLDLAAGAWWGPVVTWTNEGGTFENDVATEASGVLEAFAWHDLDGSHAETGCATGSGLVRLPKGAIVTSSSAPVASGDGWASSASEVEIVWERSTQPDLAVSNWQPDVGTWLFVR